MTALKLLALISAVLLFEALLALGLFLRRKHLALRLAPATEPARDNRSAWAGWREFRVTRRVMEDAAQSQCSFYLAPLDGQALPAFLPGQFLTFSLPVSEPTTPQSEQHRNLTRCYSLSDQPDAATYRVTIKRVPHPPDQPALPPGRSSSHFHDRVQVGDVLRVKAPSGRFHIDPDTQVPAVLIAGGIGITPMMSMLRWCLSKQPERPVHLFYGVRCCAELAFKSTLEALAAQHPLFRLHVVCSRADAADVQGRDYQHAGRIDLALLQSCLPAGRHQFHVCGPAALMQSVVPDLRSAGVPEADIHYEAFGPATVAPAAGSGSAQNQMPSATSFEVRFSRSGRSLSWDGQDGNLLDLAERHRIELPSGCRSGNCGSCETRLLAGSVSYASPPDHEINAGHCLPCVGRPCSDLLLDA